MCVAGVIQVQISKGWFSYSLDMEVAGLITAQFVKFDSLSFVLLLVVLLAQHRARSLLVGQTAFQMMYDVLICFVLF
jgi:hypothetical protein